MNSLIKGIVFVLAVLLLAQANHSIVFADRDENQGHGRHQNRERNHSEDKGNGVLGIVNQSAYAENCGACHFAYQAGLLPSGSWDKLLSGLSDHFGEAVELDESSKAGISEYLKTNAAESSSNETSRKIIRCLDGQTPLRITEIPYIQRKHHEIKPEVLSRESVGSLANCGACHTGAGQGEYDDDNVNIPK